MNAITQTVDKPSGLCQQDAISETVSLLGETGVVGTQSETDRTVNRRGRPRITTERPWDIQGISRSTYYERLKPIMPTQISYAPSVPVWCVIAFWGQAEVSATTELSRSGYETCMPLRAIRRQDPVLTSMWHTVRVPLFSGYGFIRIAQSESREPINAIRGVREILRRPDGKAAWVSDTLIAKLIEDAPARLELPKEHGPVIAVKSKVLIKVGTFGGLRGIVVQCDGVNTQVDVEMFGRTVPVWMDRVAVEEVA